MLIKIKFYIIFVINKFKIISLHSIFIFYNSDFIFLVDYPFMAANQHWS